MSSEAPPPPIVSGSLPLSLGATASAAFPVVSRMPAWNPIPAGANPPFVNVPADRLGARLPPTKTSVPGTSVTPGPRIEFTSSVAFAVGEMVGFCAPAGGPAEGRRALPPA